MLHVAEELTADAQDHRTVPTHQRRERSLAGRVAPAGHIPLQELSVGQPGDRAPLEERLKLPDHGRWT